MSDQQPNINPYGTPPPPVYPNQQPGQLPYGQQPYTQQPYGQMQPYMPAPGAPGSMTGPLKVIGILYMVFGGLALLGGLLFATIITLSPNNLVQDRATSLAFIYGFSVIIVLIGGFEIIGGYGLMGAKPWARTSGVVLACLSLLSVPLGTALGGYTLYILLKTGARQEYDMLSKTLSRA